MSYNTTYPSHSCVYFNTCNAIPSSLDTQDKYIKKTLSEMLAEANGCFNASGERITTPTNLNYKCENILYDLSQVALRSTNRLDISYTNLLSLVNDADTDLKILRKNEDPSLKKGIEEKQRDLNKSLIMNIMWTTLAVSTLYYVFRKI
jgi:hypothetical protein